MSFDTPILLIAFNRPLLAERLIESIRILQPSHIFVACDGPRLENEDDIPNCQAVRSLFSRSPQGLINWPCSIHYNLQSTNLGCRRGVVAAITWFFDHVNEGIILEDDIIASPEFFSFCEQLLEKYRHNSRIGSVCATSHFHKPPDDGASYRFSHYSHCWGWATWKRAWDKYDDEMNEWSILRNQSWLSQFGSTQFTRVWTRMFDAVFEKKIDTWDIVWQFAFWRNNLLCAVPEAELVTNIGFDLDATHTKYEKSPLRPVGILDFPLRHPTNVKRDYDNDIYVFNVVFKQSRRKIIIKKIKKLIALFR